MARIGFVTTAFARGIPYVTQTLRRAIIDLGHTAYMFVRAGMIYGQSMRESAGEWDWPNRTDYPDHAIPPLALVQWASFHRLDGVVFVEEPQAELPMTLQKAGIKTMQQIDNYLSLQQRPYLRFNDLLLCVTHRAHAILQEWDKGEQTQYIGWGVPDDHFVEASTLTEARRFDFVSSQGWIGIDARKGLDTLLAALACQPVDGNPPEVLIHCQLPQEQALHVIGWDRPLPPHVIWESGDYPPPRGVYGLGRVVVQPSKMEGLGLSLIEALTNGRPVITINAAPMHEWVDANSGWLIEPDGWRPHPDGSCYQQAVIRPETLWKTMQEAQASTDDVIHQKAQQALTRAQTIFHWQAFTQRLAAGLERIGIG